MILPCPDTIDAEKETSDVLQYIDLADPQS
jgi:hypothetical protein